MVVHGSENWSKDYVEEVCIIMNDPNVSSAMNCKSNYGGLDDIFTVSKVICQNFRHLLRHGLLTCSNGESVHLKEEADNLKYTFTIFQLGFMFCILSKRTWACLLGSRRRRQPICWVLVCKIAAHTKFSPFGSIPFKRCIPNPESFAPVAFMSMGNCALKIFWDSCCALGMENKLWIVCYWYAGEYVINCK